MDILWTYTVNMLSNLGNDLQHQEPFHEAAAESSAFLSAGWPKFVGQLLLLFQHLKPAEFVSVQTEDHLCLAWYPCENSDVG